MAAVRNDTLMRALLREPTPYTPIWLMRQAGRYLPEYNALRARTGDFLSLVKNPNLATEVTLQPLQRFKLDAAILFSDILTIPDAMGLGVSFGEGEGPRIARPMRTETDVKSLRAPDPGNDLRYVLDAVAQIKRALNDAVPLIGFSGSPFTLACYMIEGGGSNDFMKVKTLLYREPALLHRILEVNAAAVTAYLNAQIKSGVDAVMLFDTWGGILSDRAYLEFSLAYSARVLQELAREHEGMRIPNIIFTKGGGNWLESIAAAGFDAIGLDWTLDLGQARARIGGKVALQGNLDPAVLLTDPQTVASETSKVLATYGSGAGHVFNLGHGVLPQTPPENVTVLVNAVHEESRKYH
ncbi:MAG TPA: uroporphyrinogen decarboxylase [Burkholderiales bacterium]|nr:uroporphyrinogen decarboxylase [Burkholderiales bacterium]